MKIFKVFLAILAVGFTGTFLVLSNYFFEYFYYLQSDTSIGTMFYVSLAFLILSIITNILLFIFVLKDKKVITKLYSSIFLVTAFFGSALYYLVVDNNPNNIVKLISRSVDINVGGGMGFVYILLGLYIVIMFLLIAIIVKPLGKVQSAVVSLENGYTRQEIKLGSGKEFEVIEKGLNRINENYKESRAMFDKLNTEYSKYLPQQFVKELGKKSVLELSLGCNIQKEVTSVFIDIRNSTKTSYTLSLSENFDFINKYLGIIGPIVRKYNGFVDKYLGDGVLAIFLSPEVALKASNEIIRTINLDSKSLGIYSTKVGIGLHTGQVLIGVIGDKKRLSATVIADSVNSASYLEKLNRELGTNLLFSKPTLNALQKDFDINYRYVGTFELSKDNKISVFECLDCYDDKKKAVLKENKLEFENAVRCYELGGSNCKKIFEKCLESDKSDKVSTYYIEKIKKKDWVFGAVL